MQNIYYLIKLFTIYQQKNSEKYITSRMALHDGHHKFICPVCLCFYIPTVNCDMSLEIDYLHIECKKCKKSTLIKIMQHK